MGYREEQAEKTAALRSLCESVAVELGDGVWHVEPEQRESDGTPYYGRPLAYLANRVDGSRLLVEPDHRGRLEIVGLYERDNRVSYPERAEITVSATRTPEAIAREITRRLLPKYAEGRAQQAASIEKVNGHDDKAYKLAFSVAATLDQQKPEQDGSGSYMLRLYGSHGVNYGDFRVGSDYARIDISVTPALAVEIAAVIAAHRVES